MEHIIHFFFIMVLNFTQSDILFSVLLVFLQFSFFFQISSYRQNFIQYKYLSFHLFRSPYPSRWGLVSVLPVNCFVTSMYKSVYIIITLLQSANGHLNSSLYRFNLSNLPSQIIITRVIVLAMFQWKEGVRFFREKREGVGGKYVYQILGSYTKMQ